MKPRSDKHVPIETEQVYRNVDGTVAVERITREPPVEERPGRPARRPSLAGLLVGAGLTSYEQITEALEEGLGTGERLGEVIVRRGWATEEDLAELLAEQWSLPYLDGAQIDVDPVAVEQLPLATARELGALPVHYDGAELVVAIAEPAEDRFAKVREALATPRSRSSAAQRSSVSWTTRPWQSPRPPSLAPRTSTVLWWRGSPPCWMTSPSWKRGSGEPRRGSKLQEQLDRGEDTLAQLKVELELRDSLLEVLQAKLTDL